MGNSKEQLTEKAGGIIVRHNNSGETEIYLIHRPRYDDWSVPKGHIDEGEKPLHAAIREAAEETGFHCSVERELPPYFYTTPEGENVVVYFFEMKMIDDLVTKDNEADRGEWKQVSEAVQIISYQSLAKYIQTVYSR